MAEPFLSEIRIMSFKFAPKGWALCNGQLLPINQNQALFSLLGTTFGGDGRMNFAFPICGDERPFTSAAATRWGSGAGSRRIRSRSPSCRPIRMSRTASTSTTRTALTYRPAISWRRVERDLRGAEQPGSALSPSTVTNVGGSQAHLNMQPFLTLNFCIALQGIFPSPN